MGAGGGGRGGTGKSLRGWGFTPGAQAHCPFV